jgi:hypothetical protein
MAELFLKPMGGRSAESAIAIEDEGGRTNLI